MQGSIRNSWTVVTYDWEVLYKKGGDKKARVVNGSIETEYRWGTKSEYTSEPQVLLFFLLDSY